MRPESDASLCPCKSEVKVTRVKCLRNYADLFAWSAADKPGIPPDIACHHLSVNPKANWVVQCRRSQSDENAEASTKAVEDLIRP